MSIQPGLQLSKAMSKAYLDRKIRRRIRFYAGVFILALGAMGVELFIVGPSALLPAAVCLAVGVGLGLLATRKFKLRWDPAAHNVVGKLDLVGGAVLVGYILFTIFRRHLVDIWLPTEVVGAGSLATLAGLMVGQVLGTINKIKELLNKTPDATPSATPN